MVAISPNDVMSRIKEYGINVTGRTLLNYEKAKLIPEPIRKGGGRGVGKITEYPESTVAEFIASHSLIHGPEFRFPPNRVRDFREVALDIESKTWTREEVNELYTQNLDKFMGAFFWLLGKAKVEVGIPLEEKVGVQHYLGADGHFSRRLNHPDKEGNIKMGLVWE